MLKFLFKRPGDKSAGTPADSAPAAAKAAASAAATASTTAERAAQAEQLRAIGSDEDAAADFLLRSDFSELRLAAAQHITSRAQLERVHGAIRNTDRRVAKLLQGRIDALRHHDAEVARAQACLDQAQSLLADPKLSPNQVAELDRRWSVIKAPELTPGFEQLRTALGQRLEAQVALQRAMIDRLGALRQLLSAPAGDRGADAVASDLERMTQEQQAALAGPEHASLPRALVNEWATEQLRAQALLASLHQDRAALAAREAALDGWQAALEQSAVAARAASAAQVPDAGAAPAPMAVDATEAATSPPATAPDETPLDAQAAAAPGQAVQGEAAVPGPAPVPVPAAAPPLADEAMAAPAQTAAPATPAIDADTLLREWQRLPTLPAGAAADALQARFNALLSQLPPPRGRTRERDKERKREPAAARDAAASGNQPAGQPPVDAASQGRSRPVGGADASFLDQLAAMEAALEQGSLHSAAEHDKALKDSEGKHGRHGKLGAAQAERLAHARAELKRLSDWARWGGNVSREELIKAVEQLATQSLPMAELAKKVGSMRERWKALDTLSGAAPKSLWERFDAACSQAYAPAAAHFRQLAEERHANAARAQALIVEAQAQAARVAGAGAVGEGAQDAQGPQGAIDWKQMASTVQRLRLAWSHLGAIDRKEKKRLDQEFTEALNILQKPLERQRKAEEGHREALIEQVQALDPAERGALDALRAAQEKWQELARALPLERKAEQAMWQRFRAACDAVFARRKETAHAADAERRGHQAAKEALSQRLEQAASEALDAGSARRLLQEVAASWHAIGAVPRAAEAKVEQRYKAAVAAVQARVDDERRAAGIAQASALRDKLRLCQQLEAALAQDGAGADAAGWQARWDGLPALAADLERTLAARFGTALAALGNDDLRASHVKLLEANRPVLLQEVLRQEIAAGIDSGSDFARERLKLQVEVLQSSLKSGQKGAGQNGRLEQLAALPALVDERTASRIEQLFARAGKGRP